MKPHFKKNHVVLAYYGSLFEAEKKQALLREALPKATIYLGTDSSVDAHVLVVEGDQNTLEHAAKTFTGIDR